MEKNLQETPENVAMRQKISDLQKKHLENLEILNQATTSRYFGNVMSYLCISRKEMTETNTRLELTIVSLLDHISKQIVSSGTVAGTEKQKELQEELEVKETLTDQGQATQDTLQDVLKQRQQQLAKIDCTTLPK